LINCHSTSPNPLLGKEGARGWSSSVSMGDILLKSQSLLSGQYVVYPTFLVTYLRDEEQKKLVPISRTHDAFQHFHVVNNTTLRTLA
jgi:hypothetical protein